MYGGYESSANGVYADFKRYCFKDKEWSSLANGDEDGPGPRHCHSMVVHQNQIYLFGGITSVFDSVSDVHKYDLQT